MSENERKRTLEKIAEGKLSAEEGAEILAKLENDVNNAKTRCAFICIYGWFYHSGHGQTIFYSQCTEKIELI